MKQTPPRLALYSWLSFILVAAVFIIAARRSAHAPHTPGTHNGVMSWGHKEGRYTPRWTRAAWRDAPLARTVQRWDRATFHRVNHDWDSPLIDRVMPWATFLGDGKTLIVLLLGMFAFATLTRRRYARVTALLGLLAVVLAVTAPLIKLFLPRARPPLVIPTTDIILVRPLYGGSFPSGHTLVSFAVAAVLARRYPWCAPWAFGLAALVGISRMSVGVHWPTDVFAGMLLGLVIGLLVTLWWNSREGRQGANGREEQPTNVPAPR